MTDRKRRQTSARQRRALFWALMPAVPFAVFASLELALRLGGFGYPASLFIARKVHGRRTLYVNRRFGRRFFPASIARRPLMAAIESPKPEGTYRVFVLGGSAAMGDPAPEYSFGRMLERMLRARHPGRRVEVVGTAFTAVNSHVVRVVADECARLEPDLFIVLMGNNEIIGPYGPGTVFGTGSPSLPVIRAGIMARASKTGQLAQAALARLGAGPDAPKVWRGTGMFLKKKLAADDPRLKKVYADFQANLEAVIRAAKRAGARVIICTVPVNLRDSPPFASAAGGAESRYLRGRNLLEEGRHEAARRELSLARDLDLLRFRTDSRLNEIIRETASGREADGVLLFDAVRLASKDRPGGPGNELFHDHVHLNFAGNRLIAHGLLGAVESLPPWTGSRAAGEPLSEGALAESLAFTAWDRYRVAKLMSARMSKAPFTDRLGHTERQKLRRAELERLSEAASKAGLSEAAGAYSKALAGNPDDWMLRLDLAKVLEALGDPAGVVEQTQRIAATFPFEARPLAEHAAALARAGRSWAALRVFADAVRADPDFPFVYNRRGAELARLGRMDEAVADFRKTIALDPNHAMAHNNLGAALARAGDHAEAIKHFNRALEIQPGLADAAHNRELALEAVGRMREAPPAP